MRTPKDKAKQLIVQFYGHTIGFKTAAFCAIIAVGHIQDQAYVSADVYAINYWNQVREELDKMKGDF